MLYVMPLQLRSVTFEAALLPVPSLGRFGEHRRDPLREWFPDLLVRLQVASQQVLKLLVHRLRHHPLGLSLLWRGLEAPGETTLVMPCKRVGAGEEVSANFCGRSV